MPHPVIRQIIPADQWYALYLLDEEPYYVLVRLVAWGLGDLPGKDPAVVGLVVSKSGVIDPAANAEGFHSYIHTDAVNDGTVRAIIGEHKSKSAGQ